MTTLMDIAQIIPELDDDSVLLTEEQEAELLTEEILANEILDEPVVELTYTKFKG